MILTLPLRLEITKPIPNLEQRSVGKADFTLTIIGKSRTFLINISNFAQKNSKHTANDSMSLSGRWRFEKPDFYFLPKAKLASHNFPKIGQGIGQGTLCTATITVEVLPSVEKSTAFRTQSLLSVGIGFDCPKIL